MQLVRPTLSTCARNVTQSANPGLWQGLVGAWVPALGITGGTLSDVSGMGNVGTLTNMDPATDWVLGADGQALDFDGSNDHVRVSKALTVADFTVFLRINPRALAGTGCLFNGSDYITSLLFFVGAGGYLSLYLGNAEYAQTAGAVAIGNWYSVAARRSGATVSIWVNGRKISGDVTATASVINVPSPLCIGDRASTSRAFNGLISAASFYDRSLGDGELIALSADPLSPWRRIERRLFAVSSGSTPPASGYKPFYSLRKYRWGLQ